MGDGMSCCSDCGQANNDVLVGKRGPEAPKGGVAEDVPLKEPAVSPAVTTASSRRSKAEDQRSSREVVEQEPDPDLVGLELNMDVSDTPARMKEPIGDALAGWTNTPNRGR
mmetsp:Transcript_113486/g.326276  ORF Transcript_113486/g.326276 Transcript_113486/m.326276 type:complete len:111 (-) Transcript_113486:67-399(-)